MTNKTIGKVNYFESDNFYFVGNNETANSDGIEDTSYQGEIVIQNKINGKNVLEVAQYAFQYSYITKVTIYAKLRKINHYAFDYCSKIEYINIPSTVTFIGYAGLCFDAADVKVVDLAILIEFNKGRKQSLYLGGFNFARRTYVYVIYPSNVKPTYASTYAFRDVNNYFICAPSEFDFYTKQTTTNLSKCPPPVFKEACTFNTKIRRISIVVLSLIIIMFSPTINLIIIQTISIKTSSRATTRSTQLIQKNE